MPRESTIDKATGARLKKALHHHHGNVSAAAREVGISRDAARRWLKANEDNSETIIIEELKHLHGEMDVLMRRVRSLIKSMEGDSHV